MNEQAPKTEVIRETKEEEGAFKRFLRIIDLFDDFYKNYRQKKIQYPDIPPIIFFEALGKRDCFDSVDKFPDDIPNAINNEIRASYSPSEGYLAVGFYNCTKKDKPVADFIKNLLIREGIITEGMWSGSDL
jgi:hypothetical protein